LGVGRLDPHADGDQIVLTSYSGGAHCCTRVQVLTRVAGAWKLLDLGMWDGDGLDAFPGSQALGGPPAFLHYDDRFAYAFTDYAASAMPPRLFELDGGRVIDASQARRYAPLFEKELEQDKAACVKHEDQNGACAGMVAAAARLGQRPSAWQTMLDNYDKTTGWEFGPKCKVPAERGQCPHDKQVAYPSYPAALESFLVDNGYMKASDATFPTSAPVEPSFSCAKAASANLKIVCATPELIALDHDTGFEYARAMAGARYRDRLRRAQEAWIRQVNAAPSDAASIRALYAKRLAELERM
jgi:hypothetical protein